jgi:hypothetical protein
MAQKCRLHTIHHERTRNNDRLKATVGVIIPDSITNFPEGASNSLAHSVFKKQFDHFKTEPGITRPFMVNGVYMMERKVKR